MRSAICAKSIVKDSKIVILALLQVKYLVIF